jgi:hypothetical protein
MLKISTAKIARAIARAREHDAIAASWENQIQQSFHEELGGAILDAFATGSTQGTLAEFIESLDKEERASLLAIALIGRGTFPPESLTEAVEKAYSEPIYTDDSYLIGIPLLAEYLHDGMEKLGFPIAERDEKISLQ